MTFDILGINRTSNIIQICSFTDRSSALDRMHHSTFDPIKLSSYDKVARQLTSDLLGATSSLYSQHRPGILNVLVDSLLRDCYLTDSTLTHATFFTTMIRYQIIL